MAEEQRQVIPAAGLPEWYRWFALVFAVAFTALGVLYLVVRSEGPSWLGWAWLLVGLGWFGTARAAFMRCVVTPEGFAEERFFGGFRTVPWSQVTQVAPDAVSPAYRTGGTVHFADGRKRRVQSWSSEDVDQAVAWHSARPGARP